MEDVRYFSIRSWQLQFKAIVENYINVRPNTNLIFWDGQWGRGANKRLGALTLGEHPRVFIRVWQVLWELQYVGTGGQMDRPVLLRAT